MEGFGPRFHVSEMHMYEEVTLLPVELEAGVPTKTRSSRCVALSASLLFLGTSLLILSACMLRGTKEQSGGQPSLRGGSLETISLNADSELEACLVCVMEGRSWQLGNCNPTRACIKADYAECFDAILGCRQWRRKETANACGSQGNCSSCLASSRHCLWSNDTGCFLGLDYMGPSSLVVGHGQSCPAALAKTVIPTVDQTDANNLEISNDAEAAPQGPLASCVACVEKDRSWQAGRCNPTKDCVQVGIGCFQSTYGCSQWFEEQEAAAQCHAQKNCSSCTNSNPLCAWKGDSGCIVAADYRGPLDFIIQHEQSCPAVPSVSSAEQASLGECMRCVAMGKSWQAGGCNPTIACKVTDVGCFQDAEGCRQWREQAEASNRCNAQVECSRCLASHSLCRWSKDMGCLMSADYWGPPEAVVQREEQCPAPQEPRETEEAVLSEAASLLGSLTDRAR